jgi:hypothetical protein
MQGDRRSSDYYESANVCVPDVPRRCQTLPTTLVRIRQRLPKAVISSEKLGEARDELKDKDIKGIGHQGHQRMAQYGTASRVASSPRTN